MAFSPFSLESACVAAESFLSAFINSLVVFGLPMVSGQLVLPTLQEYLSEIGVLNASPQQKLFGAGAAVDAARIADDIPELPEAVGSFGRLLHGVFPRIQNNLLLTAACSVAVFLYNMYIVPQGLPALALPVLPFGVSSLILAASLVCRAMAGKSRFASARDRWGSILARSRALATTASMSPAQREAAVDFARWVPVFSAAVMCELRGAPDEELRAELVEAAGPQDAADGDGQGLSESEIHEILNRPAGLKASELVLRRLQAKLSGLNLVDAERLAMEECIARLVEDADACENVSAMPPQFAFPFGVAGHSSQFLLGWLLLLPLGLVSHLGPAMMLVQPLLGFGLLGLEDIGSQLEASFLTLPLKRTTVKLAAEMQAMRRMGVGFDKHGSVDNKIDAAGDECAKAPKLMIDGSGHGGGGGKPVLQGFASDRAPELEAVLQVPRGPGADDSQDCPRERKEGLPGMPDPSGWRRGRRSPEVLASWLRGRNLYKYLGTLVAAGYSNLQLLCEAEPDEIEQLVKLCNMPKGHTRHLKRGLGQLSLLAHGKAGRGSEDSSSDEEEEDSLDLHSQQAIRAWLGHRRLTRYLDGFVRAGYENLLVLAQAEPDAIMALIKSCEMPRGHARHFERGLKALRRRIQRGSGLGGETESKTDSPEDLFSQQALQSWLRHRRLERYLDDFVSAGYNNLHVLAQAEPASVHGFITMCKMPMGHARHLERGLMELRRQTRNEPVLAKKEIEPSSEVGVEEERPDRNQNVKVPAQPQGLVPAQKVDADGIPDLLSRDTMHMWLEERRLARYLENFVAAGFDNLQALVKAESDEISKLVGSCKMPRGHARHLKRGLEELRSLARVEDHIDEKEPSPELECSPREPELESAPGEANIAPSFDPHCDRGNLEDQTASVLSESLPEGIHQSGHAAGSPDRHSSVDGNLDFVSQQALKSWLRELQLSRYLGDFVNAGLRSMSSVAKADPAQIDGLIVSSRMPHGHARQLLRGLQSLHSGVPLTSVPDADAQPQEGIVQNAGPEEEPEEGILALEASADGQLGMVSQEATDQESPVAVVESPKQVAVASQGTSSEVATSEAQPEVTSFQAAEVLLEVAMCLADEDRQGESQKPLTLSQAEQELTGNLVDTPDKNVEGTPAQEVDSAGEFDFASQESLKLWLKDRRLGKYFDGFVNAGYRNLLDLAREKSVGIKGLVDTCKMPRGHARHLERGLEELRLLVQSKPSFSGEMEGPPQEASSSTITAPHEDERPEEDQAALTSSEASPEAGRLPHAAQQLDERPMVPLVAETQSVGTDAMVEAHGIEEVAPAQESNSSCEPGFVSPQAMQSWLEQRELADYFGDFVSAGYDNLLKLASAAPAEITSLLEQRMVLSEQARHLERSLEDLRLLVQIGLPVLEEKASPPSTQEVAQEASSNEVAQEASSNEVEQEASSNAAAAEHADGRSGDEPAAVVLSDTEPEMEPEAGRDLIESYNALDETRPSRRFSPVDERDWISQEALRLWLEGQMLEKYFEDLLAAGYGSLLALAAAPPESVAGLAEACGMPRGHARQARRAHEELALLAHRQSRRPPAAAEAAEGPPRAAADEEADGAAATAATAAVAATAPPRGGGEALRPDKTVDLFSEAELASWLERRRLGSYAEALTAEGYRNLLILSAAVPEEILYLSSLLQMTDGDIQNLQDGLDELRAQGHLGLGSIGEDPLNEELSEALPPALEQTEQNELDEVVPQEEEEEDEEEGMALTAEDDLASSGAAVPSPPSASADDAMAAPAEDELAAWLRSHRLDRYADSFARAGFRALPALTKAAPAELADLIEACGMPPGHARHLERCLRREGGESASEATTAAPSAEQEGKQQGDSSSDELDMLSEEALHAWFSRRGLAGYAETFAAEGYRSLLILSAAVPEELGYLVAHCRMPAEHAELLERGLAELRQQDPPANLGRFGGEEESMFTEKLEEQGQLEVEEETPQERMLTEKLAELEEQGQFEIEEEAPQEEADLLTCELSSVEGADDETPLPPLIAEQLPAAAASSAAAPAFEEPGPELELDDLLSEAALRAWLRARKLDGYADAFAQLGLTSLLALNEVSPAVVAEACGMPEGHARHLERGLAELGQQLRAAALRAAAPHRSSAPSSASAASSGASSSAAASPPAREVELRAAAREEEELDESATRPETASSGLMDLELSIEPPQGAAGEPPDADVAAERGEAASLQGVASSDRDGNSVAGQSDEDLRSWLERRGLAAYLDAFRAEGYRSLLILGAAVPEEIGYLIGSCGMPGADAEALRCGLAELRADEEFGLDDGAQDALAARAVAAARLLQEAPGRLAEKDEFDGASRGEALSAWLRRRGLGRYEGGFADQGYESLEILAEAEPDEIADLIEASGMLKGHARHFERGLAELRVELEEAAKLTEEAVEPRVLDLSLQLEQLEAGLLNASGWSPSGTTSKIPALMLGSGRDGGGGVTRVCFDDGAGRGPRGTGLQLIKLKKGTGEQGNDSGVARSLLDAALPWFGDPILCGPNALESSRRGPGHRRPDKRCGSGSMQAKSQDQQLPQDFESVYTPEQTPAPRSRERNPSHGSKPDYFDISEGNEDDYHEQAFRAWMLTRRLAKYLDIFLYEGYGDLQVLRDMEPDEISDLIELCNMPPGHARHFERGLVLLRGLQEKASSNSSNSSAAAQVLRRGSRQVAQEEFHTEEGLRSWLRRRKLFMYTEGIVEGGYADLASLCAAGQEDIQRLATQCGMPLGHTWHFERGLAEVRSQVPEPRPPARREEREPPRSLAAEGEAPGGMPLGHRARHLERGLAQEARLPQAPAAQPPARREEGEPPRRRIVAEGGRDPAPPQQPQRFDIGGAPHADAQVEVALRQWLAERKLAQYFDTFVREGYSSLQVLNDAEPDEVSDLIELCRMPSGHARHFERGLAQLRQQGRGTPCWSAGSADDESCHTPRRPGASLQHPSRPREKTDEEVVYFQEAVGSWLYRRKLSKYLETFVREGYSNLRILREAYPDEISDLITLCGMPPGHALHFRRGLEQLREQAAPATANARLGGTAVGLSSSSDSDEDVHALRPEETLGDWLQRRRLSMYISDLKDQGFTSLAALRDLSQGGLDDLVVSCGMKPGHAHHFLRGLHRLRNPSQDIPWLNEFARTDSGESQEHMSTSAGEEDPGAREALRLWLQARKLQRYFDAFVDRGFGSLAALRSAAPESIRGLVAACGMPPGHAKHLQRGIERLRSDEEGLYLARDAARELARRSSAALKELELVGA